MEAKTKSTHGARTTSPTGLKWVPSIPMSLCFIIAGILLIPNALQTVSAARKASLPALKKGVNANKRALAVASLPAQIKSAKTGTAQEEDDPDVPPFARGIIEKEEYLLRRNDNLNFLRGIPYDTPYNPRIKAIQEMERQKDTKNPLIMSGTWTEIGPAPLPNGQTEGVQTPVSGRTIAIAVHPTNPDIAYVGAAQGGVYRTTDGGNTWKAIFDSAQSLAAGSIAIAPSATTTVYVGTGEPGGSCDSFFGVGLYKITNAEAATPTLTGPINPGGIFTGRAIGDVIVHPTDANIIFVTTASGIGGLNCEAFGGGTVPPLPGRGLFRSTDGGTSFTKMTTATGTNILVGNFAHNELVMDPANPNRVAVAVNAPINPAGGGTGGGIYLSTDALAVAPTFTRTLSLEAVRIELALQSAGGVVNIYAASGESNGRLRRSTDGGSTWSATLAAANGFCGGQCFYDIAVAVDPTNPLTVMLGGNVTGASTKLIAKSTDGGATFVNVASGVHADNHAVTFAPSNNQIAYMGTDGGIYKSTNNGTNWTSRSVAGFNATQFMSIAVHPTDFFFTIGGTQDNGTEFLRPDNTWTRADFGDGGFALIDQNAADTTTVTMYHTYFNQANAKGYARVLTTAAATDNGWTFHGCGFAGSIPNGMVCSGPTLFYAPMTLGPGNPNTLYFGADRLYRSIDSGTTVTTVSQLFTTAISAVEIAPSNDNVRIVGLVQPAAVGPTGLVFATATGANPLVQQTGTPAFPSRGVGRAAIDPSNPNTAYVAFTGFGVPAGQHIYKTTNLNAGTPTWTPSANGIPDVPVNALAIDPMNPSVVFAGTDIGVYRSIDGGANWFPFGTGLPVVAVFGMELQNANRFLRIATHGRGMWEISLQPTAVKLSDLAATAYDQGQYVEWTTGHEINNLGFNIYRDEGGKRVRLNEQLLAGSALVAGENNAMTSGKTYGWWDSLSAGKQAVEYVVEEIDINGQSAFHGPIVARFVGGAPPERSQAQALSRAGIPQTQASRPVSQVAQLPTSAKGPQNDLSAVPAVKLTVKGEGWYKVTKTDLVAAGLDPNANPRFLQLYVDGSQLPIRVNGEQDATFDASDSVEFYGLGLDASWTEGRTYWLTAGSQPGQRIQQAPGGSGQPGASSFRCTVERRDRTIYFPGLRNGDRENFFGAVVTNSPVEQTITLRHLSQAASQDAQLEVALQGVTRGSHSVRVNWNGTEVGSVVFDGQAQGAATISVPRSFLREDANQVTLIASPQPNDVSLVDYIRVTYNRSYKADNNVLKFTVLAGQQINIEGFTSDQVRVVDVTNPSGVQEVSAVVKTQKDGSYTATVSAAGAGVRTLMAFAANQARVPAGLVANQPSTWRKAQGADLLIITRRDLVPSLNVLKNHRQSQGLSVALIDVEDLYDEMSYGHKSPHAVKDFLSFARSTWKRSPRYVLFVGDSSFDPKNYLGFGENDIVGTRLIDTQTMETASDDWFADSDDDGLAEMAVGRLPVRTSQEAAAVVAKLIGYDRSNPSEEVLLVADSSDGFNFEAANYKLRELFPANLRVQDINRGRTDGAAARHELLELINRGQKIVNYSGHGSLNQWRGDLLVSPDGPGLTNTNQLSVFVMMTCLNGYFQDVIVESLAESLLKSERGGAVAVWASTGMTDPGGQAAMNQNIYRHLFTSGVRLGDAALSAKAGVKDHDLRRTWVLFGDPTTRLR